ncbi:Undecaprenyl pyrophosphate phosphatase [Candidatus Ornithobacterium hominis]|uniref:phosphatase PAP2 family protein n=1 Tax=Candidatus Ornithobacterium hominis TaxID=2497989 RepID=UPI0024BCC8A2|nr:phosphatase PAP2 family protein [Candidatus Ornithobacterium hominis]CAI9429173.1 Undecaprenyl pyrophosphate phosphatase [Candidatus Ornithobacterium hominis]
MEELIHWDQQLLIDLNNLGSASWDDFWLLITNKYTWFPLYAVCLFLIYKFFGLKNLIYAAVAGALLVTCTDQISLLFKNVIVQRLRPCHQPGVAEFLRSVEGVCGGQYGFFSGHATNHFGIAVFLSYIFREKIKGFYIFLLITAIFVAYSRVYLGVHYFLDILVGTIVGSILGYLFYLFYQYLVAKNIFKIKNKL